MQTDQRTIDQRTIETGKAEARRREKGRTDELDGVWKTERRRGIEAARRRARALGWFSLGLGAAEIVAPRAVARAMGTRAGKTNRATLRAFGLRELACGIGILARPRAPWFWARLVGDVVDIAFLARVWSGRRTRRIYTMSSLASVVGITLLDVKTAFDLRGAGSALALGRGIHVTRTITVNRPPAEVYRFWHDFQNLPRFMEHLESVRVVDGRSHWRAKGPAGRSVEWDADITVDRPNDTIAWRSSEDAKVPNSGSVTFASAPGGRGTEVRVELRYQPPAGRLGAAVAKLFGEEPAQQIEGDLRRFKQVLETGEVVHSDASMHRGRHPARPAAGTSKGRPPKKAELQKGVRR